MRLTARLAPMAAAGLLAQPVLLTWAATAPTPSASPSASPPPPAARVDVLIRGEDNALWHDWSDAAGWHSWQSLGGSVTSSPAAVASAGGRLDVFVRGADNALWQATWNGASWSGYASLGGQLASGPAVAASAPGRLDVFVRGTDGALWQQTWDGTAWRGWSPLGGLLTSDPVAVAWSAGRLDVFARGGDGGLWHRWWDGARWADWETLGGALASNATAVAWAANRLDVFVRGTDSQLWHRWWDGSHWAAWESLGGVLASEPAAAAWSPNRLDVFVRGSDNALWQRWWDGSQWGGWASFGGALASDPAVDSRGAGLLDVFVRGTDAGIWTRNLAQGWSGWTPLGAKASWDSSPATWSGSGAQPVHAMGRTATMDENVMYDVPYYHQQYELSCEEAALQMALVHEGKSVTQTQELNDLGIDNRSGYYDAAGVLHWGDAEAVFVGDPNGSEIGLTGYGTYSAPIARIALGYGANVLVSGQGLSAGSIYEAVLQNHPVVAWVAFDWQYHTPGYYVTFGGARLVYAGAIEHAVTVVGVNAGSVLVNNPWSGPQWVSKSTFESAYASYQDMAVVIS